MPYSLGVAGLNRDGHPDIDRDGWRDIVAVRSDAPNGIWFGAPAI